MVKEGQEQIQLKENHFFFQKLDVASDRPRCSCQKEARVPVYSAPMSVWTQVPAQGTGARGLLLRAVAPRAQIIMRRRSLELYTGHGGGSRMDVNSTTVRSRTH